jgi:hypothetical protein
MKLIILTLFFVKVIAAGIFWLIPLLSGALIVIFDKERGMGTLVPCDKGMAAWIYGDRYRTISGICGERKLQGRRGYTLIANMINYLAELFGDDKEHCEREYWHEVPANA